MVSVTHSVMSWYFFGVELVDWFAFTIYNDLHWNNITKKDKNSLLKVTNNSNSCSIKISNRAINEQRK